MFRLEWAIDGDVQVVGLFVAQSRQFHAQFVQVQASHLLVQLLWQHMHADRVFAILLGPQLDLAQHLVGERVGHDEARMAGGAAQIHQTPFGQHQNVAATLQRVPVHLWLDVDLFFGILVQPRHLQLAIEVADVADDRIVLHLLEMVADDDVLAAGGGDKDGCLFGRLVHGGHLVALHGRLQRIDRIDFGDQHAAAERAQRLGASFADVTVAGHAAHFAGDHDVGGPLDAVDQRLTAAVQIVELALGHRVVDVDGGRAELALAEDAVQIVHAGRGLFGDATDAVQVLRVLFVNDVGEIAAIVEDHVQRLAVWEDDRLLDAPGVLLVGLALPGKHSHARGGDSGGCMVLGAEDIAR